MLILKRISSHTYYYIAGQTFITQTFQTLLPVYKGNQSSKPITTFIPARPQMESALPTNYYSHPRSSNHTLFAPLKHRPRNYSPPYSD